MQGQRLEVGQGLGEGVQGARAHASEDPEVLELEDAQLLELGEQEHRVLGPVKVQAQLGDTRAAVGQLCEKLLELGDLLHLGDAVLVRAGVDTQVQWNKQREGPVQVQVAEVSAVDIIQQAAEQLPPVIALVPKIKAGFEGEQAGSTGNEVVCVVVHLKNEYKFANVKYVVPPFSYVVSFLLYGTASSVQVI